MACCPPIQLWESISEKTFLLDVLVTLNDYSLINLEMQVINAQPAGTLLKLSLPNFLIWYNSLGKYQIQGRRKEQLYTKDKTALNVILSDCTRPRTFSQYVYGGSIFHS